ncbi:cholinesterase 1-like isoform X2 [Mya arenaria]|uniref:cholinesterase 1-like isoform X2 n=1 Tax=Mya arenaria TaxID=6604 RepID=UPI0022E40B55|nr:cholinesterase 1-like isoform X2 [Mya arenaria]
MMRWICSVLVTLVATCCMSRAARVTTLNGDVEGFTANVDGEDVDIYLGIPFAMPPIGDLRFRAPLPVQNWTGVFEAKTQPNSCMQLPDGLIPGFLGVEMWNANTPVSEDCLYLNLFVPRTNSINPSPTLFWIYGGSYVYGSATLDIYDGRYLAAKESVIVATVQYRMGVQGFLYTGTDDAPGNMGILDQQIALMWLHDNIDGFGGDGSNITLFGESAGAASVSHHLFAPSSWPYFNNAIMLSSTSLSDWSVRPKKEMLSKTKELARLVHCDDADMSDLVKCLRNVSADELENMQWSSSLNNSYVGTFLPTVDGVFLPEAPQSAMNSGRMKTADIMLGVAKDEGEFFLLYFFQDVFPTSKIDNPDPLNRSQFLDTMCKIANCENEMERDAILYIYELSTIPSTRGSYRDILDDILGDIFFKCPVKALADGYVAHNKGNVYTYSFEYRHSANPWPAWMGTLHGYEIELMFGQPFGYGGPFTYNETDRSVSRQAMKYISEFANSGSLAGFSSEWPEYTSQSEEHIVFTGDGDTVVTKGFKTKECSFWKYLMPKLKEMVEKNHKDPLQDIFNDHKE